MDEIGGLLSVEAKARAGKILSELREEAISQAIQWTIGRFQQVRQSQVLLAILCEYAAIPDKIGISQESTAFSEKQMRSLWRTIELARSSHRWRYHEQCAGEYSNALRVLSQHVPSLMPEAWANGSWEDEIPRTTRGVKDRVKRLRALGNCVVPAQAYPVFRAIMETEGGNRWNFVNCDK
jgi:hypothetical protein